MRFAALLATLASLWLAAPASAQEGAPVVPPAEQVEHLAAPIVAVPDTATAVEPVLAPTVETAPTDPTAAPAEPAAETALAASFPDPIHTTPTDPSVAPVAEVAAEPAADIPPATPAADTSAPLAIADALEAVVIAEPVAVSSVAEAPSAAAPVPAITAEPATESTFNPAVAETPASSIHAEPVLVPVLPAPVATPTVTLQHERLPGMCVSLSGLQGQSESRPCNASPEQEFQLPAGAVGPILHADKCVAPRGQGAYRQLYAQTCDGTSDQQWTVKSDGEIRNATGHCLSLLGASSRTGERVYVGECPADLPANHWRAVPASAASHPVSGVLESVSRPGKCLGTDGALGLVDCTGRLGRIFSFDSSRPSQLRMMSSCLAGGFALESLSLSQCWDMPTQKWSLDASANLVNLEGKCIVVTIEEGRDVVRTSACQAVPEQQWTLKETVS